MVHVEPYVNFIYFSMYLKCCKNETCVEGSTGGFCITLFGILWSFLFIYSFVFGVGALRDNGMGQKFQTSSGRCGSFYKVGLFAIPTVAAFVFSELWL